jgi:hypothetical protein
VLVEELIPTFRVLGTASKHWNARVCGAVPANTTAG